MIASSKIAVIETRLPYIDRGTLSQAWLSALHLTNGAASGAAAPAARGARNSSVVATRPRSAGAAAGSGEASPGCRPARRRSVGECTPEAPHRRANDVRVDRSGRPEPAVLSRARTYPPFHTVLTLESAQGARVHLVVRRIGTTLHVIALCRPQVAVLVRRALASADLSLRARGERVRGRVGIPEVAL